MRHIRALDGLRGVSILAVMLFHSELTLFQGGFVGVDVFFVLSGFLITRLLLEEHARSGTIDLARFYMRRILRLAPALLLLLLIYLFVVILSMEGERLRANVVDVFVTLFYMTNWARAFDIHPPEFLGHTWSLSIEEQFYILWPGLFAFMLRKRVSRLHIIFLVLFLALASWLLRAFWAYDGVGAMRLYNGLDTRADSLLIGCALALLLASGRVLDLLQKTPLTLGVASLFALGGLVVMFVNAHWEAKSLYLIGFVAIELMAAVIIVDLFISSGGVVNAFLSNRFIVWVGSISYGLYLWHYPIFRAFQAHGYSGLTLLLIGAISSMIAASLSYYLVEAPFLRMKAKFAPVISTRSDGRALS